MKIVPAIDMLSGRCVRLRQGDYNDAVFYDRSPLDQALWLQDQGFTRLHLVDLDGAKSKQLVHQQIIKDILQQTKLEVDFGGGVRSREAVEWLLDAGVQWINIGSVAVLQPQMVTQWLNDFGPDRFILGVDMLDGKVKINGWQEEATMLPEQLIAQYTAMGIERICCTDISRDGMLKGPNTALYKALKASFPASKCIASGGVAGIADVLALEESGAYEVIAGKAIFENRLSMEQLKPYC